MLLREKSYLIIILIHCLKIKYCIDHNNDLKVIITEEVNKIALSSNDDKRIQTFDKVTTYPYGTNVFKVCENEILLKKNKVMRDQLKHNKGKLKMDDYLSALINRSKNLRRNIDTYNDNLKSINSKLSTVTHTPNST